MEKDFKRLENETIKEWLQRVSISDAKWKKEAERRIKYRKFYGFIFYIQVKWLMLKRKLKNL